MTYFEIIFLILFYIFVGTQVHIACQWDTEVPRSTALGIVLWPVELIAGLLSPPDKPRDGKPKNLYE